MRTPLQILALVLLTGGCTAVKSTVNLAQAEAGLRRAAENEAAELAGYEYRLAERYLEKAKEEAGYSQHKMSSTLARRSHEWSDRAIIAIQKGSRVRPSDIPMDAPMAPPPPPQTTPTPPEPPAPAPGDEFQPVEETLEWKAE